MIPKAVKIGLLWGSMACGAVIIVRAIMMMAVGSLFLEEIPGFFIRLVVLGFGVSVFFGTFTKLTEHCRDYV